MARQQVQSATSSRLVVAAATCVLVAALYFSGPVLIPICLATLLTFVLYPLVRRLERMRLNRVASTVVVVLLAMGIIAGIGYVVAHQARQVAEVELPQARSNIQAKLGKLRSLFGPVSRLSSELKQEVTASPPTSGPSEKNPVPGKPSATGSAMDEALGLPGDQANSSSDSPGATPRTTGVNSIPIRVEGSTTTFSSVLESVQSMLLGPLVTATVVVVLVIFMLLGREDLRDRLIRLCGDGQLNLTTAALDEAGSRIMRYLVAQSLVNICYGFAVALGLWLIGKIGSPEHEGFPNWLLWALLCGILRFVPYIGIWIAMLLPAAIAFALFPGNSVFIATIGMFIAYEVVVSQFIEPYIYGSSTGMSALAVLISAVFWTAIWGPAGLLLSTPLTVCLVVLGKYVPQLEFVTILLGDEPVLELPVRIYQRLIAMDQDEAAELLQASLKAKSLDQVYDEILLPALAMAERDRQQDKLDDHRLEFVHRGMRELIEAIGEQAVAAQALVEPDTSGLRPSSRSIPRDCRFSIACIPARDQADELGAMMMAQCLNLRGYCAEVYSHEMLSGEAVEKIEKDQINLVCVSALPPNAVSDARHLARRLESRLAQIPVVVGLWTYHSDLERARGRISRTESARASATLVSAIESIDQFARQRSIPGGHVESVGS